ncbi:MAG: nitroreductase family protein, partial [Candidatus Acidiferrales bacterium]
MEKLAKTEHPIHELLARRWSPRAFAEQPVEREKLLSLLEAA